MADFLSALTGINSTLFTIAGNLADFSKRISDSVEKHWGSLDDNLTQLARNAGMGLNTLKGLQRFIVDISTKRDATTFDTLIQKYGLDNDAISQLMVQLNDSTGRNIQIAGDTLEDYIALKVALGDTGTEIARTFLELGVGIDATEDKMSKVLQESRRNGINVSLMSKNIKENMDKIQKYTFSSGVNSFISMAQNAAKVNFNMSEAFKMADKMGEGVSSAIEMGAKLQVLGGQFAKNSNPLEWFYDGISDIEKLQEKIVDTFKGVGTLRDLGDGTTPNYQVYIGREDRMRVKQAAKSMGISEDEIIKMINRDATRDEIKRQAQGNSGLNDNDVEYLQSIATINKNGKAVVRVGMEEKDIASITSSDLTAYKNMSGIDESETVRSIAIDVHSIGETVKMREGQEKNSSQARAYNEIDIKYLTNILNTGIDYFKSTLSSLPSGVATTLRAEINALTSLVASATDIGELPIQTLTQILDNIETQISAIGDVDLASYIQELKNTVLNERRTAYEYATYSNRMVLGDYTIAERMGAWAEAKGIIGDLAGIARDVNAILRTLTPPSRYNGGPVTVAHDNGGALQPATASARELVTNGGFTNDYYNRLGPVVNTQWGPERMLTKSHAMGNSIGMNEYVLSSKALANMGDGNIERGIQKADMINFGGVKPFATGGEIKISERPTAYYSGGTLTSNGSFNASGNINVSMPNLGGRITVALEGTNKNKEFDINANADAILNAIIPKLNSHIQRVFLNGPGQGENINNDTRWIG